MKIVKFLTCSIFLSMFIMISACGKVQKVELRELSWDTYVDKVKGGWLGEVIGVQFGEATEGKFSGKIIPFEMPSYMKLSTKAQAQLDKTKPKDPKAREKRSAIFENVKNWESFTPEGGPDQDDIYVELTFLAPIRNFGLTVTAQQAAQVWLDNLDEKRIWVANRAAFENFKKGIFPPASGHPDNNQYWDQIDFQIESDLFGLIAPGLPQVSNQWCDKFGHMMNFGDGVYGGIFVAGMYTQAFFENNPVELVKWGLQCIPAESRYAEMIRDLLGWRDKYPEWTDAWKELEKKYGVKPDGKPISGVDVVINGAYIVMGLLYGGGDFHKTMEISSRCGRDSDCNPSNSAGIIGCVLGANQIPPQWKDPIRNYIKNSTLPKLYPEKINLDDLTAWTADIGKEIVVSAGGSFKDNKLFIPVQVPIAPVLESPSTK